MKNLATNIVPAPLSILFLPAPDLAPAIYKTILKKNRIDKLGLNENQDEKEEDWYARTHRKPDKHWSAQFGQSAFFCRL